MTKARTLADNYAADINQVSAGVGITGGGTSGTVTITNDMATTIAAKGDLVIGTGNDTYNRLAVASTAGYVLTVDSAEATGLKWAAVAAGGKVLQAVTATYSTAAQNSSTTYADTGLSVSITPSSTSSKVLVMAVQPVAATRNTAYAGVKARLVRTSTELAFANIIGEAQGSTLFAIHGSYSPIWLDSPATTSSVTYKTQFALVYTTSGGWLADAQPNNAQASIVALEIGA